MESIQTEYKGMSGFILFLSFWVYVCMGVFNFTCCLGFKFLWCLSPIRAKEGDIRILHWYSFMFFFVSYNLLVCLYENEISLRVLTIERTTHWQRELLLPNLHLLHWFYGSFYFCGYVHIEIFQNKIGWFITDKRCGSFE